MSEVHRSVGDGETHRSDLAGDEVGSTPPDLAPLIADLRVLHCDRLAPELAADIRLTPLEAEGSALTLQLLLGTHAAWRLFTAEGSVESVGRERHKRG